MVNHGLSVVTGFFLTIVIPMDIISLIAAFSFIVFGLWILRGDKLDVEDKRVSRFGPVATVGIAFFLAEIGDKTQLTAISLAVRYQCMLFVLMGTTLGMLAANSIGIIIGVVARKSVPEKAIRWFSAILFMLFGFHGIHEVLSPHMEWFLVWGILIVASLSTFGAMRYLVMPGEAESQ